MRRIIRYILLFPFFLLIVVLAVANRAPVSVSLNPFDPSHPALTLSNVPLFVLIFCALLLGIFLGGIGSWLKQGKWRRMARHSQNEVDKLQRESGKNESDSQIESKYALSAPNESKVI